MLPCFRPSRSSRCRTSCCSPTCSCRCTSSSRGTARWWPTRWPAIASSAWCCCRPGYEADYEGRPAVYPVGCAGRHHALRAARRRPLQHRAARASRSSASPARTPASRTGWRTIDALPELTSPTPSATALRQHAHSGSKRCSPRRSSASGADPKFPPAVPDEDLVNALAQYLELEPLERQALLERDGILARCRGAHRAAGDEDDDAARDDLERQVVTRGSSHPDEHRDIDRGNEVVFRLRPEAANLCASVPLWFVIVASRRGGFFRIGILGRKSFRTTSESPRPRVSAPCRSGRLAGPCGNQARTPRSAATGSP